MPVCSVCGKEVNFKNIAYIYEDTLVCKNCFPMYYVRNLCKVVERRLRGENPLACLFCAFKRQCDEVISKALKSLT